MSCPQPSDEDDGTCKQVPPPASPPNQTAPDAAAAVWGTAQLVASFGQAWKAQVLKEHHEAAPAVAAAAYELSNAMWNDVPMAASPPTQAGGANGAPLPGDFYRDWLDRLTAGGRQVVPIVFAYQRESLLMISIQERQSGHYYDFATKRFVKKPTIPRAAMTWLGTLGPLSQLYGAAIGRSGNLHGQYIVTVRDTDSGAIVALLSYAVTAGIVATERVPQGLEDYVAEQGLPALQPAAASPARSGRAVELD
jgi:hypothetical protein